MTPRETRTAFEGLYRSHRNEVYRAAMRKLGDHHEAEDVTQTAFLDAYRAMLRGSHPDLPRAWLLAIAENVRRRRFRTALRRPREEPLREALPSAEPPWRAQTAQIRAALSTLPANQRKAFLLRELGGFSYGEIAAQLDTSVPSVQMLLFRARQKLRAELDQSRSVRVGGLIPVPHWLLGFADRAPAFGAGPRVAGLVAASVLAIGAGVASDVPDVPAAEPKAKPAEQTRPAARVSIPARIPAKARAAKARPKAVVRAAAATTRAANHPAQPTRITVSTPPARPVADGGGAEPVAPVASSATLGTDDRAPAPTLVPALPPVSQAPIVSVTVPPPPPLPELPVELPAPALPVVPIEPPPLAPALPGDAEVTIPEVPSLPRIP